MKTQASSPTVQDSRAPHHGRRIVVALRGGHPCPYSCMGIKGIVGIAVGYGLFLRPRLLHWGATKEEVTGPFPGAGIVPGGKRFSTMAVTLDGPPSRVWPWLVQMGYDRAGWYSWDLLDHGGKPSARRLHQEWQDIAPGDRLLSEPKGPHWFEVAAVEPERFLALRAAMDLKGRQFDSSGPRPRYFTDSLWAFQLDELPDRRTRLVVSAYSVSQPKVFGALTGFLFWEPAHWIMQTRQFQNLKARVERPLLVQKGGLQAVASAE